MPLSETELHDIIKELSFALDKRPPHAVCQVSPRVVAIALAHFEELKRDRELPNV